MLFSNCSDTVDSLSALRVPGALRPALVRSPLSCLQCSHRLGLPWLSFWDLSLVPVLDPLFLDLVCISWEI